MRVLLQSAVAAVPGWSLLFSLENQWGTVVARGLEAKLVFELLACQQTLFRPCYNNPFAKEDLAFGRENGLWLFTQTVHGRAEDTGPDSQSQYCVLWSFCCQGMSTRASFAFCLSVCVLVYGSDLSIPLCASSCPSPSLSFLLFFFLLLSPHLTA